MNLNFPPLILMSDYNHSFTDYFRAVYNIFEIDFIKSNPSFEGVRVSAKKFPEVDGIHRTFYHITHEGPDEGNRMPDIRRMERIKFPKFIINGCPHVELLVWEKQIGRDTRIHILNETENYLIVLNKRDGYNLFWTAFYIEHNHTLRKKKEEYEAYIKAKTAKV